MSEVSGYNVEYSQRRVKVRMVAGSDTKGHSRAFYGVKVILNVNSDRLTSITVLDPTGKAVCRFPRNNVLVDASIDVENLVRGVRLSRTGLDRR
jgi:hypothetical protein